MRRVEIGTISRVPTCSDTPKRLPGAKITVASATASKSSGVADLAM
jgi:hypothetical protein